MKKIILTVFSFVLICLAACKKNNDQSSVTIDTTSVTTALIAGTWKASYLLKNGINKTSDYGDYKFTFNSNGLLTGANSLFSENGSWSVVNDSGKTKLVLNFPSPSRFEEVKDDWEITSKTETRIVMQHVSSGGGQTNYLTIDKL